MTLKIMGRGSLCGTASPSPQGFPRFFRGFIRLLPYKYDFYTILYDFSSTTPARRRRFLFPLRGFLGALQPVHAHAGTQPLRVHSQQVHCAPLAIDPPVGRLEGRHYLLFLVLDPNSFNRRRRGQRLKRRIHHLNDIILAQHHRPLDHVLQRAHVPRPRIPLQVRYHLVAQSRHRLPQVLGISARKMRRQDRDVLPEVPQRRQRHGEHVQAIE